jgi:glycogen phosphorylase
MRSLANCRSVWQYFYIELLQLCGNVREVGVMSQNKNGVIAFLTPEVAPNQDLHTYSGGLGVFSGGMLMSAHKLGIPMVGVSLLPTQGYYEQYIDGDRMGHCFISRSYEDILEDTGVIFSVEIKGSPVWVRVLLLPEGVYGSSPVYFLHTDIEENNWLSRSNGFQLYPARVAGSTLERLIVQAIILGKGGVEALRRLGISVALYHINESHAAFAPTELYCEFLRSGKTQDEAMRDVREKVVFTTHTPVKAGNPEYDLDLVSKLYLNCNGGSEWKSALERVGGSPFNMAAAAFRLSRKANAVSRRHLERTQKMWAWLGDDLPPLISITNGVCQDFWQDDAFRRARTADDIAEAKQFHKAELAGVIQRGEFLGLNLGTAGRVLDTSVLTLVWARRFARYKRPKLLIRGDNFERLKSLLSRNLIQVVFAGKPHLDDEDMIREWNDILYLSRELPNFYILPGYELAMSKLLKFGADVWLNTPRAPDEACGTSGMSGAMNGAFNLSTPDGWMREADAENCALFGSEYSAYSPAEQDGYDAEKLRERLSSLLDRFYLDRRGWNERLLRAKREAEKDWTSERMVSEYCEKLYAA